MDKFSYKKEEETTIFFDLPDSSGLRIKSILRGVFNQPLAIIIHGRPGSGNELLTYLAARYLYEEGIASLRVFMYDFEPHTRNLLDCTLETNAQDLDTVVGELKKLNVPKIYAIGHSYGGMAILKAKAKLDGAVLWDPTHGSYWIEHKDEVDDNFPEKILGDILVGTGGYGYVNSVKDEEYDQSIGDTTDWAAHKGYPLKVISAGLGAMTHLGKSYVEVADEPKEHLVINEAHHQFEDSDVVVFELLSETAEWLKNC
jgi:pimeloyl-ACP methyl ester carboxylesterase